MIRQLASALAAVCLFSVAPTVLADPIVTTPPASPMWGPEHYAKIREEIRLNEQRAHELEPVIARDRQARHDVEADWVILERHARELRARANDFRGMAAFSSFRGAVDLGRFASDLDTWAAHDDDNARWKHEIAERLDHAIQSEADLREWHLRVAQQLRDWLSSNGG